MTRQGPLPLEGRRALVTGASRGIGAAIAIALARAGADVAINYLSADAEAERVRGEAEASGARAALVRGDARTEGADIVTRAARALDGLDILVSNASARFPIAPFLELDWAGFEGKLVGEIQTAFSVCQPAARLMAENGGGDLVLVSSMLSRRPVRGFVAHGTAKAALTAFGRYLAKELGPLGIKTNIVAPGLVITDATRGMPDEMHERIRSRTPLRRLGSPDDVADAVLGIVMSRHINGAYLPVNGGADLS